MSDQTPEQEAVRRLLADARHEGPTPPEVVARLDETLASLVAERVAVVDLSEHRQRRRRAGIGLVAAAAVVVGGVAVTQVLPSGSDGGSDSATSGVSADDGSAPREYADRESANADGSDSDSLRTSPDAKSPTALVDGLAVISLADSDGRLGDRLVDLRPDAAPRAALDYDQDYLATCDLDGVGPGRRLLATVDGERGLVLYEPAVRGRQAVDVYVCGEPEPRRTVVVPAP